jgi:DNA-binding NtrC family response regulator
MLNATEPHDLQDRDGNGEKFEFAFSLRRKKGVVLKIPNGLVVSSDEEVRRKLAETLGQCGLAPVFASTVAGSEMALCGKKVFIVLCHNFLIDGKYEDIVKMVTHSGTNVPVIVVSRTADWPEYLTAIRAGVFDYLAYPPIAGDLQRIIRNALLERNIRCTAKVARLFDSCPGKEKTWAPNQ